VQVQALFFTNSIFFMISIFNRYASKTHIH
jgi:hypothetical protein